MESQAEVRQKALDSIFPAWTAARQRVAEIGEAVEQLKGELKSARSALTRQEAWLEHVAGCRQLACIRCGELAANGPSGKGEAAG